MTFVFIDKYGNELISNGCFGVPITTWMSKNNEYVTTLPKGTIEILIGREGILQMDKEKHPFELKIK
jgi:hypothetical protein